MNTRQLEDAHTSGVYPKRPLTIVRGEGAILYDDAGNRYVDCAGGQGGPNLGRSPPGAVRALPRQAENLIHCPEIFYHFKTANPLGNPNTMTENAPAHPFHSRTTGPPT